MAKKDPIEKAEARLAAKIAANQSGGAVRGSRVGDAPSRKQRPTGRVKTKQMIYDLTRAGRDKGDKVRKKYPNEFLPVPEIPNPHSDPVWPRQDA